MIFNKLFSNKKIKDAWIKNFVRLFAREDNWHNIDLKNNNLGYGWLHYAYIRNLKPRRVLCVGSRYGYIPAICAMACRDNGFGVVDFVDASFDQTNLKNPENHWGGMGFWKKVNSSKYFGKFSLEKNIELHIVTTAFFKEKYPKRKWGYIHLDGDHSYHGVKFDFLNFWPNLKKGGICALHDIYPRETKKLNYGVYRLWNQLKKSNQFNSWEFPGAFGLGLIQK